MRKLQDANGEVDFPMWYYTVQPNRWTFQSTKIKDWVELWLEGRVLNACAGKTKLDHDGEMIRNDVDTDREADIHVDVNEIAGHFEANSFDTIIFDPPFSDHQASETYDSTDPVQESAAINQFDQLLKPGGKVVKMGFSTTCMPGAKDYERKGVAIFNTLGRMDDWLGVVDQRMSHDLRSYEVTEVVKE